MAEAQTLKPSSSTSQNALAGTEPEVEELGFQRATPIQKTDILNDALTVYHSTCPCCPGKMGLED